MNRDEALLKLLAVEPVRRDRLAQITGWPQQEVDATLDSLLQHGLVSSTAGDNQAPSVRVFFVNESLRQRLWRKGAPMAFELARPTEVEFFHVNVRSEFHGEEHVRAVDIGIRVKGDNTLLDLIKPGLREHHFCDVSSTNGQQHLPLAHLPNVRHPELATKYAYAKGQRWHGYTFKHEGAGLFFEDCAIAAMVYEFFEGSSTEVSLLVQYNGRELENDKVYGRCAGLATDLKGKIELRAPAEVLPITDKNWRSGVAPQEPSEGATAHVPKDPRQADFQAEAGADTEDDVLAPGTPAGALAGELAKDGTTNGNSNVTSNGAADTADGQAWPFPLSTHKPEVTTRKRRRAAAQA